MPDAQNTADATELGWIAGDGSGKALLPYDPQHPEREAGDREWDLVNWLVCRNCTRTDATCHRRAVVKSLRSRMNLVERRLERANHALAEFYQYGTISDLNMKAYLNASFGLDGSEERHG